MFKNRPFAAASYTNRRCRVCDGLDEFMYELNWRPVYYCAHCDRETNGSGSELVGPEQRQQDEAGE